MSRAFTPKIVAANDLRAGHSVWLTELGGWSDHPGEALLLTTEDEARHHLALAARQDLVPVGVTLVDAEGSAHGPVPTQTRERIRVTGPFPDATFLRSA